VAEGFAEFKDDIQARFSQQAYKVRDFERERERERLPFSAQHKLCGVCVESHSTLQLIIIDRNSNHTTNVIIRNKNQKSKIKKR
jgi:hypothetical protein